MSYRLLKLLAILLPTLFIGGFEFIRHAFLLDVMTMKTGNYLITLLTLFVSYAFSWWMFRMIGLKNQQLADQKTREAVYEERERIARELHDSIAQILFFLNVKMKQGHYDEAKSAISEIDNELRQAIFNLRSSPEDGISMKERLSKWLDEWNATSGIDVSSDIHIPDKYFTVGEEIQLFAIIQEAFTNIRKHSEANQAQISIQTGPDHWSMEITDDGTGLADQVVTTNKYGSLLMKKRATELQASFEIANGVNGGTQLRLRSGRRVNQ